MKISKNKIYVIVVVILAVLASTVRYFGRFSAKPEKTTAAQQSTPAKKSKAQANNYQLAILRGGAFGEAFSASMLAHHEGAVNMSELPQAVTAYEEIRNLVGQITQTQSLEMIQMRKWQKEWAYEF